MYPLCPEQVEVVVGRAKTDGQAVQNSHLICQTHANQWLHRYQPNTCAVCQQPFSTTASSPRPCPDWLQQATGAHAGSFVHMRPCYLSKLAERKQQQAPMQPHNGAGVATSLEVLTAAVEMEVEKENADRNLPAAQGDVQQEQSIRKYLKRRLQQLSPCRTLADAAARTPIPLRHSHGGRAVHVMIVSKAASSDTPITSQTKRRRLTAHDTQRRLSDPSSIPASSTPSSTSAPSRLSVDDCLTFRQLTGQMTRRHFRRMNSFLQSRGLHLFCTEQQMREREHAIDVKVESTLLPLTQQRVVRVTHLTQQLSAVCQRLFDLQLLAPDLTCPGALWLQVQIDKGDETTKGLLKVINVQENIHSRNQLPLFLYRGNEEYSVLCSILSPMLDEIQSFTLPPPLRALFTHCQLFLTGDTKLLQTMLGLSVSGRANYPCPFCLQARCFFHEVDAQGCLQTGTPRNSLHHWSAHLRLRLRHGDSNSEAGTAEFHNCIHPPFVQYGIPLSPRNWNITLPILHINTGIVSKWVKLVRKTCEGHDSQFCTPPHAAFTTPVTPLLPQFHAFLAQHRLQFKTYHGETLIGPQVHRLIGTQQPLYPQLLDIVKPSDEKTCWSIQDSRTPTSLTLRRRHSVAEQARFQLWQHLTVLFDSLAAAYPLYTADRFLTPLEIELLTLLVQRIGVTWITHFPYDSITPKLHFLTTELPRFAQQFRTVGMLSEQNIEAFHGLVKQLERDYAGMGDSSQKDELIFKAAARKLSPLVGHYEPPKRHCSKCRLPIAQSELQHCQCA